LLLPPVPFMEVPLIRPPTMLGRVVPPVVPAARVKICTWYFSPPWFIWICSSHSSFVSS
jgi:hypothetical protein